MLPHTAPSVAIRTGSGVTVRPAMPSRSRCYLRRVIAMPERRCCRHQELVIARCDDSLRVTRGNNLHWVIVKWLAVEGARCGEADRIGDGRRRRALPACAAECEDQRRS